MVCSAVPPPSSNQDDTGPMKPAVLWITASLASRLPASKLLDEAATRVATDPTSSLVFPDDDDEPNTAAWRKGRLATGNEYWWRELRNGGEPEISLTDPSRQWEVASLPSGRQYYYRSTDDPNDPEIRLLSEMREEPDEAAEWKVGVLASGRKYLWRETDDPDDPDVKFYHESKLESGAPFWYDDDGEVVLSDPFAGRP